MKNEPRVYIKDFIPKLDLNKDKRWELKQFWLAVISWKRLEIDRETFYLCAIVRTVLSWNLSLMVCCSSLSVFWSTLAVASSIHRSYMVEKQVLMSQCCGLELSVFKQRLQQCSDYWERWWSRWLRLQRSHCSQKWPESVFFSQVWLRSDFFVTVWTAQIRIWPF